MRVLELYFTNESELWSLAETVEDEGLNEVGDIVEYVDRVYDGVESLIILFQVDGPTGVIPLDYRGQLCRKKTRIV